MGNRFKVTGRRTVTQPHSTYPEDLRDWMKKGFKALEVTVKDAETGQVIEIGPFPFTDDKPEHKRNVEKMALEAAAKVVRSQR